MKFDRVFLFTLSITSAAARHALQPRQETGISTTLTNSPNPTNQEQTASTTSRATVSRPDSSDVPASSTGDVSDRPTATESIIATTNTTTRGIAIQTPASNTTSNGDPRPLPIPPKITPGIGFAGALLMITGLCYGMIGIKNKMLYRFFGVAYLATLAVTVLIIYCMNPPVSNGIQGGFVVAAIFAGILSGALSLLFPDMIEGFGCMLGGYCLSMWFLCLKDGGLIQQRTGKVIFIACMSVAAYTLSFSHYTRTYGLIVCIPFSGATAAIIGIDCFSRAGLKEMWIYVWDINDDVFPLNTHTYPITRGIRVETAGVILLFLLGLITHVRLSKIIKQRRDQKMSSKAQQDKEMEREEAAVGRRVEETIGQERVRWESVYGGGKGASVTSAAESTDSMAKNSDMRLSSTQDLEMSQISLLRDKRSSKDPKRATVTVTPADNDGDEIKRIGQHRLSGTARDGSNPRRSSRQSLGASTDGRPVSTSSGPSQLDRSTTLSPAPEVVPLPFRIPGVEIKVPKSDIGSLSAIEESFMNKRASHRASGMSSAWKRMSGNNALPEVSSLAEDFAVPHDDDNASSIAATMDRLDEDDMSLSEVSLPRSPVTGSFGAPSPLSSHRNSVGPTPPVEAHPENPKGSSSPSDTVGELLPVGPAPAVPEKSMKRTSFSSDTRDAGLAVTTVGTVASGPRSSATSPTKDRTSSLADGLEQATIAPLSPVGDTDVKERSGAIYGSGESLMTDKRRSGLSQSRREGRESLKSASAGPSEQSQVGTMGSLMDHLPDQMSKVVLQYRTNEWAKHLSVAEEPVPENVAEPPSPGIIVDTTFNDIASQEHTPISPVVDPDQFIQPMAAPKSRWSGLSTAQDRPKSAVGSQSKRSSLNTAQSRPPSGSLTPNNLSTPQLQRPSSSSNLQSNSPRASRNMSTPQLIRQSTEPINERPERPRPERMGTLKQVGSAAAQIPSQTLLGKRESLVKNKPSSMSFAQSSTPNLVTTPPTEAGSRRAVEADDVPLAVHSARLSQQKRQDSWPPPSALQQPALNQSTLTLGAFDSHQPQRQTSKISQSKRESMLTSWRESLRAEQQQAQQPGQSSSQTADEARRQKMISEKRQKQMMEREEKKKKTVRDDRFDQAMRNGTMIDAHRKALQRMQSDAK